MKDIVACFVLMLFFHSCSEGKRKSGISKEQGAAQPFLFEMQHFFTQSENFMSLPVWFNESDVAAKKLFRFTRNIYHVSLNTGDETEGEDLDLREVREYFFSREGKIDSIRIDYYFDDHKIGIVSFGYPEKPDKFGFHKKVDRILRIPGEGGLTPQELPFMLFAQRSSSGKFLSFKDQERWVKYHYMLNEKDFGPLSVDSVINPGPDDILILGTPEKPFKMYQVVNKVHERNVHIYNYFKGTNLLESYSRSEYPFDIKRTISYDQNGICTGYVDSTFSGKMFLSRTEGKFNLNNRNLPVKLERLKENQESSRCLVSVEKYFYEYYQD